MLERLKYVFKPLFRRQFAAGGVIPGKPVGVVHEGNGYIYYKGSWYFYRPSQGWVGRVGDDGEV